jgi:hypothetical protein
MAGNKGIVSAQFYTFSATNRTITFTNDYAGLDLGEITYITNIKNGVATVIYDPFDATKGGTLSGLTLTLAYDTTLMADTDPLQIITGFTPQNADPTPVRIVEGPDQIDDTALLQNISDNLDFLNLALDQNEGIQMNVREVNSYKKDTENALILSDTIEIKYAIPANANPFSPIIDTKGYQQIQWNAFTGYSWAIQNVQFSNDQQNWVSVGFITQIGSGTPTYYNGSLSASGYAVFTVAVLGRYFRLQYWNQNNAILNFGIVLKNAPLSTAGITSTIGNIATSTIAGNATQGYNAFQTFGNTLSVAGQTQPGSTSVPYPIIIGGISPPAIGSLAGVARSLILDNSGRTVLGADNAFLNTPTLSSAKENASANTTRGIGGIPNNIVGAQSLTVTNVAQDFGDTQVMLMRQILTELKILNQNFAEMPNLLNQANFTISDPQEYRDDMTFQ